MRKKKKNGFTLVEILITIAIISIIGTIVGTTIFDTIKNSKEKSLEITKNNILKAAKTYVEEYPEKIAWIKKEPNTEVKTTYSCISTNELVNKNLLKKDNIKNNNISKYVIIWKNNEKIVTSEEFNDETNNICKEKIKTIKIPTAKEFCNDISYTGQEQQLVKQPTEFNFDFTTKKDAGNYKITAILNNGDYWSDGTTDNKSINCSIKKAIPKLESNPNNIETNEILTEKIIKLNYEIPGTIIIKVSNPDYYEAKLNENDKEIIIKPLSTRDVIGTITITLIPNDSNNYYNSSIIIPIHEPIQSLKEVELPTCITPIVYNGSEQNLVSKNIDAYSLNMYKAIEPGTYEIKATLKPGYKWKGYEDSKTEHNLSCTIEKDTSTITYKSNNIEIDTQKVTYQEDFTLRNNTTTYDCHLFNSWNENINGTGKKWDPLESNSYKYPYLNDITLHAQWDPIKYTIKYDGNGHTSGSTTSSNHDYETYKNLTANGFIKTGYIFKGWNRDYDGKDNITYTDKELIKNLTCIDGDIITLYAQWEPIKYTIKYDGNGHTSGTTQNSTHIYDEKKSLNLNKYVYNGHQFIGWSIDPDGKDDILYKDGSSIINLTAINNEVITLYAQWEEQTIYTIKYDPNGGTGTMAETQKKENESVKLSENKFTNPGYNFKNWNTKEDGSGISYKNNETINTNSNLILYAQWDPKYKVNIYYNPTGGTVAQTTAAGRWTTGTWSIYENLIFKSTEPHTTTFEPHTTTINFGSELGKNGLTDYYSGSNLSITKKGYIGEKGAEWKCLSGCTTSGKTFSHAAIYSHKDFCDATNQECTVILGVNWKAINYTIKYDANGGTGTMANSSHTYDIAKKLTKNAYTNKGHTFKEWNTKKDGTGTSYTYEATVKNLTSTSGEIVTLYAIWTPNKINVKFHTNGGTIKGTNTSYKINSNGLVLVNGNEIAQTYNYGASIDLLNYNNSSYLYITKKKDNINYYVNENEEWNTKADGSGISFSQFGSKHSANELCNANQSDCTITLYVNWKIDTVNGTRYNCHIDNNNNPRLSILNITTCNKSYCNFSKLNGLTTINKDMTVFPSTWEWDPRTTWTFKRNLLGEAIGNSDCQGTTWYVSANSGLNCRKNAVAQGTPVISYPKCSTVTAVRTTTRVDSSNNWYYNTVSNCYLSGQFLTSSKPSSCTSGNTNNENTGSGNTSTTCPSSLPFHVISGSDEYCCNKRVKNPHDPNNEGLFCNYLLTNWD